MKTLISLKKLKKELEKQDEILQQCYQEIKKEYIKKIEAEKKLLLSEISAEYDIDNDELIKKFMVKKK